MENLDEKKAPAATEATYKIREDYNRENPGITINSSLIDRVIEADLYGTSPEVPQPEGLQDVVQRLAGLPVLEYEQVRETEAKTLGLRVSVLDGEVRKAGKSESTGMVFGVGDIEPWPEPVSGDVLLDSIHNTITRFIVCPDETAVAATLWIAFTWFIDSVDIAPLAVITAPEKRCGKTQLLTIIGKLARRPVIASNLTPAVVFRMVDAFSPTLLIDEADSFFNQDDGLRGIVNAGFSRQSCNVFRCVGDNHELKPFSAWGAKVLCGIGNMPDTIMDRAIVLALRRRTNTEPVDRLRHGTEKGLFSTLSRKLARFAMDNAEAAAKATPTLPEQLNDRAQDCWEPILAIADIAGGRWPKIARAAAVAISGKEEESASVNIELLSDINEFITDKPMSYFQTKELIQWLIEDDEKPWATYNRGNPITARQVSTRLKEFGIERKSIRDGTGKVVKAYRPDFFNEAFCRYVPMLPSTSS